MLDETFRYVIVNCMKFWKKYRWYITILIFLGICVVICLGVKLYKTNLRNEVQRQLSDFSANQMANQISGGSKQKSLPEIINEWRPRIAYIECIYGDTSGKIFQISAGTGVVSNYISNGSIGIFTNKHVLLASRFGSSPKYTPESCSVKLPNNDEPYEFSFVGKSFNENLKTRGDYDFGALIFSSPDKYVLDLADRPFQWCRAPIGDQIIVLGYPSYGSRNNDITITEGIISGYDFPYYTTSAKIEHGNSGGVAIDVKNNCYIGIPTGAITGDIESLGRILDVSRFINLD